MITIRKAVLANFKAIQDLNHKLFLYVDGNGISENLNVGWSLSTKGRKYFKQMISKELVLIAEDDGIMVGYLAANMHFNFSYEKGVNGAELDNMYIEESCRGKGVGGLLVSELKKRCIKAGITNIRVTVSSGNKKAIGFYTKNGFAEYNVTLDCIL